MAELSGIASEAGALVIADEILTGLGRCGAMFASERVGLRPDLLCIGKALGGGMPLSACLGSAAVMDSWPESDGEALHTSTFLGHPLSCAAALAALDTYGPDSVVTRADEGGARLLAALQERLAGVAGVGDVRGLGLLIGIELVAGDGATPAVGAAARAATAALTRGVLVLPAGDFGQVLELTPAVVLTDEQADYSVEALGCAIEEVL